MKLKTSELRQNANAAYTSFVISQLNDVKREALPRSTNQAASTQKLLAMTNAELEIYQSRKITQNMCAVKDSEGNPFVNERGIPPQQWVAAESARRAEKNIIGQSELSGVTQEKKDRAVHSYMSVQAQLDALEKYKVKRGFVPLETKEQRPTLFYKMFGWLMGFNKLGHADLRKESWRDWV